MPAEPILGALKASGTAERAQWDMRYHKSSLEHFGVAALEVNRIVRVHARALSPDQMLETAGALWDTGIFDCRIAAGKMLALPRVKPSDALWQFVCDHLTDMDGWAVMDTMAKAAWKCLRDDPSRLDEVEGWTNAPAFWIRRAALVYTLPWAKKGMDPDRMLGWAAGYAADREWFIQKAVGWWLRELSKHDPARVEAFLAEHDGSLMAVARREAVKYL